MTVNLDTTMARPTGMGAVTSATAPSRERRHRLDGLGYRLLLAGTRSRSLFSDRGATVEIDIQLSGVGPLHEGTRSASRAPFPSSTGMPNVENFVQVQDTNTSGLLDVGRTVLDRDVPDERAASHHERSLSVAEPFLSEIRIMCFEFAPKGWALCNGQLLPINQNQALFSLLGTTFGGDGRVNFALPDLRGSTPIHVGSRAHPR